jgi:hypothetical protein
VKQVLPGFCLIAAEQGLTADPGVSARQNTRQRLVRQLDPIPLSLDH